MAQKMENRVESKYTLSVTSAIFIGTTYCKLSTKYAEINGKKYDYKYFSHVLDIAIGLSTNGFAPFKIWKSMAWLLIIFNYNLPPEICFHIENILSLGAILSPKEPVDADSFLILLIMELDHLAEGVHPFYALESKIFALCTYLIIIFRDTPAISMLM